MLLMCAFWMRLYWRASCAFCRELRWRRLKFGFCSAAWLFSVMTPSRSWMASNFECCCRCRVIGPEWIGLLDITGKVRRNFDSDQQCSARIRICHADVAIISFDPASNRMNETLVSDIETNLVCKKLICDCNKVGLCPHSKVDLWSQKVGPWPHSKVDLWLQKSACGRIESWSVTATESRSMNALPVDLLSHQQVNLWSQWKLACVRSLLKSVCDCKQITLLHDFYISPFVIDIYSSWEETLLHVPTALFRFGVLGCPNHHRQTSWESHHQQDQDRSSCSHRFHEPQRRPPPPVPVQPARPLQPWWRAHAYHRKC